MHPLRRYLEETGEPVGEFCARICMGEAEIDAVIAGKSLPSGAAIQRMIAESGGALSLFDFFGCTSGNQKPQNSPDGKHSQKSAEIVDLADHRARLSDDQLLNQTLLTEVMIFTMDNAVSGLADTAITEAAEAAAHTYLAMARITSRHGQFRLVQALEPAIEQILETIAADARGNATAQNLAVQAASLYEQCRLRLAVAAR